MSGRFASAGSRGSFAQGRAALRARLSRWGVFAAAATGATLASIPGPRPRPLLIWNASPSSPTGLYRLTSLGTARRGDMVVAWAPPPARRLAAARGYVPATVPLVKPVAAVRGDRLCAKGNRISVNGRMAAVRRSRDRAGRRMPSWSGCTVLRAGQLLLLSEHVPEAFDGRYFGATRSAEIIGKARLLWPR